jgi:NAD(P)-dependent dehydrogenase (short-subunit alcohol dehydrogenase family)
MQLHQWNTNRIPSQGRKVVIVTGASSGIGFEVARALANKQATVILAVRNVEKGNQALARIISRNRNANISVMQLDMSRLASIEAFARQFKQEYWRLDLLINNAGVMVPPYSKTFDGFELQFGTNHLGHFALTGNLLGLLISTQGARIVNVTSGAHKMGKLDFDDLNWEKRKYAPWKAYGDSKLANVYFTYELDRRIKENNLDLITTMAHPGLASTELKRTAGKLFTCIDRIFGQKAQLGALPTLRAATESGLKGAEYFGPAGFMGISGRPIKTDTSKLTKDITVAKQLWEVSEKLTGVKFEFKKACIV